MKNLVIGIVTLLLTGYILWLVFFQLEATVQSVVLTAITSVTVFLLERRSARISSVEEEHRKQKNPKYRELIDAIFQMIRSAREQQSRTGRQLEFVKKLQGLQTDIIVWGSPDVLKAYGDLLQFADKLAQSESATDPRETLSVVENLVKAVRHDLGHGDKALDEGDILRTFITDYDRQFRSNQN